MRNILSNIKLSKNIKKYGFYTLIAISFILIIIGIILFYKKAIDGFNSGFGNIAKEFNFSQNDTEKLSNKLAQPDDLNDRYILNLEDYVNIIGFKIDTHNNIPINYRLYVKNDILNEYINVNNNFIFRTGQYYDIRNNNYNINKLLLVKENLNSDITELNNISSIKIYGITQFDKLVDENINIKKSYDTGRFTIEFKKISGVNNIEYYYIVIAKYDRYKEFLNKKIIRLNNNKINFIAELKKLIPLEYIKLESDNISTVTTSLNGGSSNPFILSLDDLLTPATNKSSSEAFTSTQANTNELINVMEQKISNTTTIKEASVILNNYRKNELIKVYKLILKNQYLENNKSVAPLLENINDYSTMKFLSSNVGDDNNSFKRKYTQNHYHYQSDEVKELLTYVNDLVENYEDACDDYKCTIISPKLEILDNAGFPYLYKVGVGYVRLDVLGNEIYSPVTSYKENDGEVLFKMQPNEGESLTEEELTTGDNLFNKIKMVNNASVKKLQGIIGSNYPNNFYMSDQNLQNYVNLDEYKKNKYSPIQFNVNILEKEENQPTSSTSPSTSVTQSTSSFVGNYKNAEDSINDLLS